MVINLDELQAFSSDPQSTLGKSKMSRVLVHI